MATARPYRLYASEYSYFSGKVRPALRMKRVPFEEVLPTRPGLSRGHPARARGSP